MIDFWNEMTACVAMARTAGHLTTEEADVYYIEIGKQRADAQALADVRTLDARQDEAGKTLPWEMFRTGKGEHACIVKAGSNDGGIWFEAATPDEARAKAAAWVRSERERARKVQEQKTWACTRDWF